jgi:hypothetical protein
LLSFVCCVLDVKEESVYSERKRKFCGEIKCLLLNLDEELILFWKRKFHTLLSSKVQTNISKIIEIFEGQTIFKQN